MELWIRSQYKEGLIKVNNELYLSENDGKFRIETLEFRLGEYKTKERALEVLDEIQEAIEHNGFKEERYVMAHGCYETIKKKVYEMPK